MQLSIAYRGGVALAALALSLGVSQSALAEDYPSKPIQMIVAYGAGGSTDTMARIFAKYAEEALGQRIVVVNYTHLRQILTAKAGADPTIQILA